MPLIHKVAIVNEKGDVKGYLRVAVQAVVEEENADFVNGVKQSAKIAFDEEMTPKSKTKQSTFNLNEKNNQHNLEDRIVEGQESIKIEGLAFLFLILVLFKIKFSYSRIIIFSELALECDADSGRGDSSVASELKEEDLPDHLTPGRDFTFRVTVLQAQGISTEYADVFCQFK